MPVDVRQPAVQDDHVVRRGLGERDRRHAVGSDVDDVALGRQHPPDERGHLRFVFDHEDSHAPAFCGRPSLPVEGWRPLCENSHPGFRARRPDPPDSLGHTPLHPGDIHHDQAESRSSSRRWSRRSRWPSALVVAGLRARPRPPTAAEPVSVPGRRRPRTRRSRRPGRHRLPRPAGDARGHRRVQDRQRATEEGEDDEDEHDGADDDARDPSRPGPFPRAPARPQAVPAAAAPACEARPRPRCASRSG